jgi:hypothetical protein
MRSTIGKAATEGSSQAITPMTTLTKIRAAARAKQKG